MKELVFQSDLTSKEIDANFKDTDIFSGLTEGLEEALSHASGHASKAALVRKRSLPTVDPALIRTSLHMTQRAFAEKLGVSPRTVEAWESGRTTPAPTAKKLLRLIQDDHSLIQKL